MWMDSMTPESIPECDSKIYDQFYSWTFRFQEMMKNSQESLVKSQNRWCFVGQRVHVGNPGCHKQLVSLPWLGMVYAPFYRDDLGFVFFYCVNHFKIFCYLLVLLLGKRDRWRDLKRLTPREVTHKDPNVGQTYEWVHARTDKYVPVSGTYILYTL